MFEKIRKLFGAGPPIRPVADDRRRSGQGGARRPAQARLPGSKRGGASSEQVAHAFEILLSDKNVKAVLINIFGGILRVDTLATGVVEAARKTKPV